MSSGQFSAVLAGAAPPGRRVRVGIVGVSGYGGGEVLRLCASHPAFNVVYVAGESSAGQKLVNRFPGIGAMGDLTIRKFEPSSLPEIDVRVAITSDYERQC